MRIFTDTHIGRRAGAHTTHNSSKMLDQCIVDNALLAATDCTERKPTVVCVGDLFDKSHNKESDILDGAKVAKKCDLILAGNHDLSNRDNVKTSIEIIGTMFDNVVSAEVNEVLVEEFEDDTGIQFSVIPHHSSQDLFDQAIEKAVAENSGDIVFLHCNFNSPFAHNDASLNLSPDQAELLLTKFKYIVMGHEHQHRWEMDGRLLIPGNTHPTSFGDIGDKWYWDYREGKFWGTRIWSKKEQYARVSVNDLLEGRFNYQGQNFIEIYGREVEPELATKIAHFMKDLWGLDDERLLMVRNNVEYKTLSVDVVDQGVQLEDLTEVIGNKLAETDLNDLWVKHLKECSK